jgi:membrane associated rhomboid family serine protease
MGVIATWWVGLSLGVLLALASRTGKKWKKLTYKDLIRPISILMTVMFCIAFIAGIAGFYLSENGIVFLRGYMAVRIPEKQHTAFIAVACAHLASYIAGFVGGIILCIKILMKRKALSCTETSDFNALQQ